MIPALWIFDPVDEAVAGIEDGSTNLVGGFGLADMPFVSRVSTDQGVFEVGGDRVRVRATYGVTLGELRRRLAVDFEPAAGH